MTRAAARAGDTASTCELSRTYVSNEEATLVAQMRAIKDRVQARRQQARADGQADPGLEQDLAGLRREWQDLAARLERATHRKHMMLGHAPWDPGAFDDLT